jgi:diaminopimelate decarboxylase
MLDQESLARLKTPCYLYDLELFEGNLDAFARAFFAAWQPGKAQTCYSVKTAPVAGLLKTALAHGWGAEAVSDEEYDLARSCGFSSDKIVFNGPVKSRQKLLEALREGALVNLDSWREVEWACDYARECQDGAPLRVGLRVKPEASGSQSSGTVPSDRCLNGASRSRFGFDSANGDLRHAVDKLRAAGIEPFALHIHVIDRAQDYQVHCQAARLICSVISELQLSGLGVIDMGGGYIGGGAHRDRYGTYANDIASILAQAVDPARCALVTEPGGSILGCVGSLVGRVIDTREAGGAVFVTTELSTLHMNPTRGTGNPRPYEVFYTQGTSFSASAQLTQASNTPSRVPFQIVGGFTCMEQDRLYELHEEPRLRVGDIICVHDVGAYTQALAPRFFIRDAPPSYGFRADGLVVPLEL